MPINIIVSRKQLGALLSTVIFFHILLLLGTFVYHSGANISGYLRFFARQSNLGSENVFASWYSSVLLFCSAIMSFACFILDKKHFKSGAGLMLNYGWLIYSGCFAALSLDEMGSLHEQIGDYSAFKSAGDLLINEENSGWIIFYYLIIAVSLFMLLFSLLRLKSVKWSLLFLILGVLAYLSNLIQENYEIENYVSVSIKRPTYFLLIEEGSELLGSLFFLISTVIYAVFASKQFQSDQTVEGIKIKINIPRRTLILCIYLFIFTMAVLMFLLIYMFGYGPGQTQVGVPANWVPSVLAFMISIYCLYVSVNNLKHKFVYLTLALLAMFISVCFGCDGLAYLTSHL